MNLREAYSKTFGVEPQMKKTQSVFREVIRLFWSRAGAVCICAMLPFPAIGTGALLPESVEREMLLINVDSHRCVFASDSCLLSKRDKDKSKKKPSQQKRDKDALEQKYNKWQALEPEEKKELRRRMNQWRKMSPQERKLYEAVFRQWQQIPDKERRKLSDDLNRWDRLSAQEKALILRRFKTTP